MATGDKSFGLVLGIDEEKTKARIEEQLNKIIKQLNSHKSESNSVSLYVDKTSTQKAIISDLSKILNKINTNSNLKFRLQLDPVETENHFQAQIEQVIKNLNSKNLNKISLNLNIPNATQKQTQSNKNNSPVPSTNSAESTFTSEQALNQYNQYVNRLERLANEVKQKAIGSRNIKSGFLPNAQISIDDYLKRLRGEVYNQGIKDSPQNMTREMYSRWEMLFHTLSTGVQEVESSLSTLDKQQSLTKIQQEWIAFAKQVDKSKFATEDLRNSVKKTLEELKNVNAGTTANDINQIISSLQNLKTGFKKQETNYDPINLKEREKQLQHYRSLLSSIENTKALSQQYTDLKKSIELFSNAQTGTEYQQQLQSLRDIEKQIQNTQKQFGQNNIGERWKQNLNNVLKLQTELENLGLTESSVYTKTVNLVGSLKSIRTVNQNGETFDNTALRQWTEQFKTLRAEVSRYKETLKTVSSTTSKIPFNQTEKYNQLATARGFYAELKNTFSLASEDKELDILKKKTQELLQTLGKARTNDVINQQAKELRNLQTQYRGWSKENKFTVDTTKLQQQKESFVQIQKEINTTGFASNSLKQSLSVLAEQLATIKTPADLVNFEKSLATLSQQAKAEKIVQGVELFNKEVQNSLIVSDKLKNSVTNLFNEITRLNSGGSFNEIIKKNKAFQNLQQQFNSISPYVTQSQMTSANKRYSSLLSQYRGLNLYDSNLSEYLNNAKNISSRLTTSRIERQGSLIPNPEYLSREGYQYLIRNLDEVESRIQILKRDYSDFIQRGTDISALENSIKRANGTSKEWESTLSELRATLHQLFSSALQGTDASQKLNDFDKQLQNVQEKFRSTQSKADNVLKNYYLKTNSASNQTYQVEKTAIDTRLNTIKSEITKQGDKVSPEIKQSFEELTNQAKTLDGVYTQLSEKFKQVQPILQATAGDFSKLTDSQKDDLRTLQGYETSFNKLIRLFNTQLGGISSALKIPEETKKSFNDLKELQQTIARFGNSNNRLFQNNYFKGQFTSLSNEINQVLANSPNGQNISAKQVDDFTARWRVLRNEILNTGATGQTFGTKLASQFSKLGVYFSAATVFMRIRTYMRNMYENVKEVDNAMTSLKRVTKETHDTYKDFFNDSIDRAKKLGATLSDTINATADFKRLGYSLQEATELADTAITYQQVGDEVEDIGTATSSIVSTMKAFGIQAEDSMSIVDRFNEVANNFSITAGGIGQALQNSASSLSAANNTLDESLGLIIAGNNVVQNPNEVGTALKTLTMRLRNAKADLSSLGEDTDGMADSTSKLRTQIKALSGVDIMETEDSFKSTYQILKELSKVWNNLTDINQASLTELIAGKRQGNLMSSIMTNFADAENVVRVASRSMGSAETEHEKKLQSINGKLNILQSTFQELSDTVMEDDVVKGAIKGLTALLDIINRLVKSGGSLKTVATILGTALLSFNNKGLITKNALGDRRFFWNNYISQIQDEKNAINTSLVKIFGGSVVTGKDAKGNDITTQYTSTLNEHLEKNKVSQENIKGVTQDFIKTTLAGYNQDMIKGIENTNNLADAQAKLNENTRLYHTLVGKVKAAGKTIVNVGLSFVNMLGNAVMSMAVSALIGVVISAIRSTRQAIDEANQATQDFISRSKDLANTQDSIVALKEKLADKNITESEALSVRKELYDIQKDMIDRYGAEAKGIDLVKDSVDGLNDSFESLRVKELRNAFINNAKGYQKSVDSLYGKGSINSFGWNTGNETIYNSSEHSYNPDLTYLLPQEVEDYLSKEFEKYFYKNANHSGGTSGGYTYHLNLGAMIKDTGGTKVDLVKKYNEVLAVLENILETYRQEGKSTATLEKVIANLSKAKNYWEDTNYQSELANTQAYAEYLVLTTDKWKKPYSLLEKAKEDYDNAIIKGDANLIERTVANYQTARQKVADVISGLGEYDDEGAVKDFLQSLVDTANNDLTKADFKLKVQANEDNLRTNLEKIIKDFSNGKKIFADDIINFNPDSKANQQSMSIVYAFQLIQAQADKTGVSLETFVDWLVELGLVETDVAEKKSYSFVKMLDMTSESMEAVTKKIDEVQNAFKTVKEVIEDYEDKKILTIDSAQKLIDLGDNYIQYLFDENGHLKINEEAYSKLTRAKIDLLRTELLQNAIDNIKQIKTETDAVEYLKDKITEETKATQDYNTALLRKLYLEGMSNKSSKVQQAVKHIYDTYINYSRILDNVNTSYKDNEMSATSETKALNDQKDVLEKQKKALDKSKTALDDNKDALDKNKQALEDVNTELEKDKDYIEDLISLTVDMLKQKYEDEKETIEKSKQAYKEKVEALKNSLDEEKEAYDRYQSYTDKNKNISLLEQQASALKGTKSVEGIQRLNEINKDLSEKQQELYDEQYSNSIDDRKNALDKEYEHKEKLWDKEINRIDELLQNERQLRVQAMNLIDSKTQQFYNNLWDYTYKHTTKSRFEFENLWNSAYKALEKYGWGQLTCMQVMDLLEQKIYNNQMAIDGLDRQIKILNTSLDGTAKSIDGISREIDKLDEKINELSKSYEKATETKNAFYTNLPSGISGYQATLGGNTYVSSATDMNKASADILSQYNKYVDTWAGQSSPYHRYTLDEIQKQLVAYAKGTSYSKNGLAIVDEDGLNSEWILKKGRLDYLPEGSVVFNQNETKALKMLSQNSDKVKQIIDNPDYLSYFRSHIEQGTGSNLSFAKSHGFYQNVHTNSKQNINMPMTFNIANASNLDETKLAEKVTNKVFKEIGKYIAWYG